MVGTKSSPLIECVGRSRSAVAAPNEVPTPPVVIYFSRLGAPMYVHEKAVLVAVAEGIARLDGRSYAGIFDAKQCPTPELFFVPDDTLMRDEAQRLGISSPRQLYGAVVPFPFAKTKAITHRLIDPRAAQPCGWSAPFTDNVGSAVLPGYTAFDLDDAQTAARRLLAHGPVRVKEPLGAGGRGQAVIGTIAELGALLEGVPTGQIARHGLVLETNLRGVTTRSVGCTMIGDRAIAYHGVQRSATNNHGVSVYGGSHLTCVRGGWAELLNLPMDASTRRAITQARIYDGNATHYPGFVASRRNYDVGQGIDGRGQWRSGVLEASWRSGGASTAELAALTAFTQDPAVQVVEAAAVKHYGKARKIPPGAIVHFEGDDPEDGPLLRYTVMTRALRRALS